MKIKNPVFTDLTVIIKITLICLTTLVGHIAEAYMMGDDNRVSVVTAIQDVSGINQTGQIQIPGEAFVTGLVLGANCDVVLSAGHAAIHWEDNPRQGWIHGTIRGQGRFLFSLNPVDADSFINMHLVTSGFQQADKLDRDDYDWAVFRLQKSVSTSCVEIPFTPAGGQCMHSVIMPGFHFDKPVTRLVDQTCRERGRDQYGIIVHDCDTKEGSSGAPLFCNINGELTLLGINISGLTRKEYHDPGVYGKQGGKFHYRQHKNYAVSITSGLYQALQQELKKSLERAQEQNQIQYRTGRE